jgi:hypothetical protein
MIAVNKKKNCGQVYNTGGNYLAAVKGSVYKQQYFNWIKLHAIGITLSYAAVIIPNRYQ